MWTIFTYAFLEFSHRNPRVSRQALFEAVVDLINGREERIRPKEAVQQIKELVANPPQVLKAVANFTPDGWLPGALEHLR